MTFATAKHMPMGHGQPLSGFLGETFIFIGLFIILHSILDLLIYLFPYR